MPKSWLVRGAETAERSRRRMQLLGVTPNGHPLWEPREIEAVVGLYPAYQSIFPELERRTHPAVYSKAGRLGITRPRAPALTDNEIMRLRKVYPKGTRAEIEIAFPSHTYAAIARAANARGIYRAKRRIGPTGIRLLDQVLERAFRDNLSLTELDEIARTGTYFRRRRWRTVPDTYMHCLAARALGGRIRASFK